MSEEKNTGKSLATKLNLTSHKNGEVTQVCYSMLSLKQCEDNSHSPNQITLEQYSCYTQAEVEERVQLLLNKLQNNGECNTFIENNKAIQTDFNCLQGRLIGYGKTLAIDFGNKYLIKE